MHPEILARQRLPAEAAARRRLEAPVPGDQRLGALPRRQRLPVVKIFLNLSKEEQRKRFLERIDLPGARTGSSPRPTSRERRHWDDYQEAFSEMLSATSTEWAPWYVVPADRKWFARIAPGRCSPTR